MSDLALPALVYNLGGEMLYILNERLVAQKISAEKSRRGKYALSLANLKVMLSSNSLSIYLSNYLTNILRSCCTLNICGSSIVHSADRCMLNTVCRKTGE
jgi:hypothetical protein